MKKYFLPLIAASIILSAPLAVSAATPQELNKQYNDIRTTIRQRKYTDAVQAADAVLADKELSPKDRARFLALAAEASANQGASQYAAARAYYEKIIEDAAIDNTAKIDAINGLADAYIKSLTGQYLDRMDLAPAHNTLNRALQLPELKAEERALALLNIGRLYDREDKNQEAIDTYLQIQKLDVSDATKDKAWQAIIDVYVKEVLFDDDATAREATQNAVTIAQKQGFDLLSLYNRMGDFNAAKELLLKVLDDPQSTDAQRWAAFSQLPCFTRSSGLGRVDGRSNPVEFRALLREIQEVSSKYLPGLLEADPSRGSILLTTFKEAPVSPNIFYYSTNASPDYVAWAGAILSHVPKLSDKDYILVKQKYGDALAAQGDIGQIVPELQGTAEDARVDESTKFWAKLASASLVPRGRSISEIVGEQKTLSEKEKAQAILDAAQTVLLAGKDSGAQNLYEAYKKIVPDLPTATIKSTFMEQAPTDVGSWMNSEQVKSGKNRAQFDRPYGDNLKLLQETDANVERAATSESKNAGDRNTDFYVATDSQGIHFFIYAHDEHAQKVQDGLLRGSEFETYFAPGENQPYYWLMPKLPNTPARFSASSFVTMYPNANWRMPSTEDGTFRSDVRRVKDGFGITMSFSWELFYDKLPRNGTKWRFESIRWTRSGGFSFAGSQSVHNPSSWGDIVFDNLTPQNITAIKRAIIFSAVQKYQEAKRVTSPVMRWNDAELGDPAFYQRDVAPLLARLDGYAARTKEQMTDADIEDIFQNAVPGWMELEHNVDGMRAQYLKNKMLAK